MQKTWPVLINSNNKSYCHWPFKKYLNTWSAILLSSDCLSSCLSCMAESRSASAFLSCSTNSWPASAARNMLASASTALASMALKASSDIIWEKRLSSHFKTTIYRRDSKNYWRFHWSESLKANPRKERNHRLQWRQGNFLEVCHRRLRLGSENHATSKLTSKPYLLEVSLYTI